MIIRTVKPISSTASRQRGLVLVFALLVLLSITVLGVSSVSSSLLQGKMASSIERKSVSFDAAEAAIAGVMFEAEDESLLADPAITDALSQARQAAAIDLSVDNLSCFDEGRIERRMTKDGATFGQQQTGTVRFSENPKVNSWSRTAFVQEQACRGSSNVIGGSNINCHVFIIRGCGQTEGSSYVVANSLTASVFAPATNQ